MRLTHFSPVPLETTFGDWHFRWSWRHVVAKIQGREDKGRIQWQFECKMGRHWTSMRVDLLRLLFVRGKRVGEIKQDYVEWFEGGSERVRATWVDGVDGKWVTVESTETGEERWHPCDEHRVNRMLIGDAFDTDLWVESRLCKMAA